jgi:hypothetical protein
MFSHNNSDIYTKWNIKLIQSLAEKNKQTLREICYHSSLFFHAIKLTSKLSFWKDYLCNQCLSPLKLCEFESCSWQGVLDTTLVSDQTCLFRLLFRSIIGSDWVSDQTCLFRLLFWSIIGSDWVSDQTCFFRLLFRSIIGCDWVSD